MLSGNTQSKISVAGRTSPSEMGFVNQICAARRARSKSLCLTMGHLMFLDVIELDFSILFGRK